MPGETKTAPAAMALENHRLQDRLVPGPVADPVVAADGTSDRVTGPGTLNRRTVLLAAIELVDAGDLRQLTMRRLGARLGVEAMALYHYVRGREDLLDGIADLLVEIPPTAAAGPPFDKDWRAYLVDLAGGLREVALAHPRLFPLVATRRSAAAWIRPPLRSVPMIESFLQTLVNCGFTPAAAARAYRSFSGFLLAALMFEVTAVNDGRADRDADGNEDLATSRTDLTDYPAVRRLAVADLTPERAAAEFDRDLALLLDGLEAVRASTTRDEDAVGESNDRDISV